jgi:hypothetical protein
VTEDNEYEEMKAAIDEAMKNSPHVISKLDIIETFLSIDIVKMLDELAIKLAKESYSKDYIGGLRHARDEIKEQYSRGLI